MIEKSDDYDLIRQLRLDVFYREFGISEQEIMDSAESVCEQFLIVSEQKPVGTFRLNSQNNSYKLERMCILCPYRKKNVGRKTIEAIIQYSKTQSKSKIILDSILSVSDFYEKCGFQDNGQSMWIPK